MRLVVLMGSLLIIVVLLLGPLGPSVLVLVVRFRIGTGHIGQIVRVRHGRYDLLLYKSIWFSAGGTVNHRRVLTNLWRSPTAAGQRQSVGAERTRSVQSGYALLALVAAVALATALAQRTGVTLAALLATRSLLAGNTVGAGQTRIAAFALRAGLALSALHRRPNVLFTSASIASILSPQVPSFRPVRAVPIRIVM